MIAVVCYGTQLGLVPPQSTVSVSTLSLTPGQCGRNLDHGKSNQVNQVNQLS